MEVMSAFFSECIPASSKVVLSPNGLFLACNEHNQERLLIRDIQGGLKIANEFSTLFGTFDQIEWSSDSVYIAVSSVEEGLIQVFSMAHRKWKCKLDIGNSQVGGVGLLDFAWSPNSRHLLTTSSHHVQLTVWSLTDKDVHLIRDILPVKEYKTFSPDGKFMAVVKFNPIDVRKKSISVYDTSDWKNTLRNFPCSGKDVKGAKWCPDGTILIWDSPLFSNLFVYSDRGELMKHFSPDGLALGIQSITTSPTGQFIAFTNHKHQLRLMNTASYGITLCEPLDDSLIVDFPDALIYSETSSRYRYKITKEFVQGSTDVRANWKICLPKLFQSRILFNWDGSMIAAHSMKNPQVLWVFDISKTRLIAVLGQQDSISDFCWHPFRDSLCIATGTNGLYFWNLEGCYAVQIPEQAFLASKVDWSSDGLSLVVTGPENFIVCYFQK